MKKKVTFSLLLGVVISAAALYFAFKNVPFGDLVRYLGAIDYRWVFPAAAVGLGTFIFRALRWQIILGGKAAGVGFWQAFHPMMIGFMINCILPGRAGEVARPIILSKKDKIPFTTGLATVAAERVFDIGMLIAFFAVVLTGVQIRPDLAVSYGKYRLDRDMLEMIAGGMLKLCLVLAAGIVVLSMRRVQRWLLAAIAALPALLPGAGAAFRERVRTKVAAPLARLVENFVAGFGMVRNPLKVGMCIGLSFLVWYLTALSYYLLALGCPGIDLSFLQLSAVMIIVCFFIALPSVPGFWGLWEAGGVFALTLFGVPSSEAAGMTLVVHAAMVFPVILTGMISAVITGINIWRITSERVGDEMGEVLAERPLG